MSLSLTNVVFLTCALLLSTDAPECKIRQTEKDGEYLLICEVDAVPDDVTFTWRVDNQTVIEGIRTEGRVSTLTVLPGTRDFGTYYCHVNNSVGAGVPCEIDVTGEIMTSFRP